jgi:hypothetical protein
MREVSGFKVLRCSPQDLEQFMGFVRRVRAAGISTFPLDKTRFFSKYAEPGKDNKNLNLFVLKDPAGEIAGCSGYMPFKGLFNKKTIQGIVCTDVVVDPVYREKFPGLFILLIRNYEQFLFQARCFPLFFPLDDAVRSFKERFCEEFARIDEFRKLLFSRPSPKLRSHSIELRKTAHFGKDIDSFFQRVSGQHDFLMHADRSLLNLKYFHNPYGKYIVVSAFRKKKILGYIVAETRNANIHIVDIVADLDYPQVIVLLIYKSLTYFSPQEAKNIICYVAHRKYKEILKRAGFLYQRTQVCLFFRLGLLFTAVDRQDLDSSDKDLYHFNGISRYLY